MDLNALKANYQPINFGTTTNTATQNIKKKGRGGPLTSFISELGGTGGALGGAAAGAALGSVVPVLGTAVGGLAGALLGGFAGGTGGRALENKIRDDQNFFGEGGSAKDALTEGAISGVMGAGPLRLLKAGGGIAKGAASGAKGLSGALTSKTGQTAEQAAARTLTDTAATSAPLKTSMAGKADALGDRMLGKSQWGVISKPGIRANDPAGTSKSMYNMGLTKNTDIEQTAQAITGSDGILNKAVSGAVDGANPLQTGHLAGSLKTSINKSGIVDSQAKGLTNEITADLNLIDPANPKSALEVMRNLKARQQEYLGKGETYHLATSLDKKRAKVIGEVHDEIENTLYNTAGANKNLSKVLTPQLRDELVALHPDNAQWVKHVDTNIMSAKSVGDLRSAQAPFVKAGKLISEGEGNKYSAGGQMVNSSNGIKGAIIDAAANFVKQPLQRAAGTTAKKVAPMLPGGSGVQAATTGATGLAGALSGVTRPATKNILRNEALGLPVTSLLTGGATADAAAMPGVDPVTGMPTDPAAQAQGGQGASQMGQGGMQGAAAPGTDPLSQASTDNSPFNPANVETNIQKLLANGGKMSDVKEYLSMVSAIQDLQSTSSAKLNSTAAGQLASSANGSATLDQLEGLYSEAGGGGGKIGGGIANGLSKLGLSSNTQVYNDLAGSSVSQLAKALNGGGQVSDTDAAVVIQALPKITDSPAVAQAKFRALKARLAAAQQNTLTFSGGAQDPATGAN